ncbi:hypothetical protein [Mucilaginibacter celer]|uniref:Uncharacterized protein n=1 Tax=Mucilaginibacter celer TaxID=2305508 RepID=A0A494VPV8_9SPHI|nr:hypothetical protein [Mucilaginibacter celer]AYL97507.1 hypothetical protein HYN43_020355 [Mucilaginibacter celer]
MNTNPVFNRRHNHNNTPASVTLIITNFIVFGLATQMLTSCAGIKNFFWVVLAVLAVYNYFTIRKYREEYEKPQIIAYVLSLVVMLGLYFVLRYAQHC